MSGREEGLDAEGCPTPRSVCVKVRTCGEFLLDAADNYFIFLSL
jgi:hypothetical protein